MSPAPTPGAPEPAAAARTSPVRVALLDGPPGGDSPAARHARAMAAAIRAEAGAAAEIVQVPVLGDRLATSVAAVVAGFAAARGAAILHCSFGLARPDPALAEAVADALDAGALIVAAAPARGGPVWPAAFPGVIAAQGDARCAPGVWSLLADAPPRFGACPRLDADPGVAGASLAAARVIGLLAARFAETGDPAAALAALAAGARFRGPERRRA